MARKTTTSSSKPVAPAKVEAPAKPKKLVAKRVTKPAVKAKPTARATKPAKSAAPKMPSYTSDDVALRAYFISEKRRNLGLPGDEHQDWLEAERQLVSESGIAKKARKA